MNPDEILRIVDQIHLDRKIDKEIVFHGIEQALIIAARKHSGEDSNVVVHIDRLSGEISAYRDNIPLTTNEIAERIGAQTAKQVMIQKIREAERDALYNDYQLLINQLVNGSVHRNEANGACTITLSNTEGILPRSEKIPGESYRNGERIQAIVVDVKKSGTKLKVILSRSRPAFVERLLEQEVPEIQEGVIQIKGISREAGHRSKVAVACDDPRIDSVGACIGIRRSRIRNITDELNNERIDVVSWSSDMLTFIPQALQPANVDEVILCSLLGRAIVLVQKDQRSLAIGRKGQNVRLASRLCDWDIEIMTRDELDEMLTKAFDDFVAIKGISTELADRLVGEGFFTYDDLSIIEPSDLMEMGDLSEEEADEIVEEAERLAEENEKLIASKNNSSESPNIKDKKESNAPSNNSETTVESSAENSAVSENEESA